VQAHIVKQTECTIRVIPCNVSCVRCTLANIVSRSITLIQCGTANPRKEVIVLKIGVKKVGKDIEYIETSQKYRTDCCKEYTGKDDFVEYVRLVADGTFCIGVNEMGLPKEMATNFLLETTSPHFPIQKMVGTVVFVRTKPVNPFKEIWDYEVDDLNEADIQRIEKLLDKSYQEKLKDAYLDYGKGHMIITPIKI